MAKEIGRVSHKGSGNSLADYDEISMKCEHCNGEGEVVVTIDDYMTHLVEIAENMRGRLRAGNVDHGRAARLLIDSILDPEGEYTVECPECEGAGVWTELR